MSVISGYNCTQKEAAICEACDQAIDDSYVIKLLNETMGPQTVSTFFMDTYLYDNICKLVRYDYVDVMELSIPIKR